MIKAVLLCLLSLMFYQVAFADVSMSEDQTVVFANGKTDKERKEALHKINLQGHSDRQKYNQIGLKDPSPEVRAIAAYFLHLDLVELTPILLKAMTSDPAREVRLNAALNLECQYNCNGVQVEPRDIQSLESDLRLLEQAIRNETSGRYVIDILINVWCKISEKSRKPLELILKSDLPYGDSTVGINEIAKFLLKHHSAGCQ